ncbi:MAG TPA: cobalt ECF transporter T component CbiQ [Candidatus Deferrimicrobiaceae bacterium]|jgi:cobalt/nickel transport system permease protein
MGGIDQGLFDLDRLDRLAGQDSAIHRLDPRAKLLTTAVFLLCVVSHGKYEISGLLPFALFPIAVAATAGLPAGYLVRKLLAFAPFALVVGAFNPLFDREVLLRVGSLPVSGGWVSFASILLRFCLTIGAALVLIGTTSFRGVCMALERLGVPSVFATQLLFLHRYIFVLGDEAVRMARARALRSFDGRGMGLRVYASLVGHLLLRTLDRGQRIHLAMRCRGFDGRILSLRKLSAGMPDIVYTLGWSAAFVGMRVVNVPQLLGRLVTEVIR